MIIRYNIQFSNFNNNINEEENKNQNIKNDAILNNNINNIKLNKNNELIKKIIIKRNEKIKMKKN